MQIIGERGFSPRCRSVGIIRNAHTIPAAESLNCRPCVIPLLPSCSIAIAQTASTSKTFSGATMSVGFASPAVENSLVVLLTADDSGLTDGGKPVTMTGWTEITGMGSADGDGFIARCFVRVAGPSEASSYSINADGESACCCMVEITGAHATNPEDYGYVDSTDQPAGADSTDFCDLCLDCVVDLAVRAGFTPPTGYTLGVGVNTAAPGAPFLARIAYKTSVGTGTITPGPWGSPETAHSYLWTLLFKKA